MTTYLFGIAIGFVLGWLAHSVLLQIAYRMGIVSYNGTKDTK